MTLTTEKPNLARSANAANTRSASIFVPESFDWPALTAQYSWIQDMRGVAQNPVYHGESDVWVHTRMVAQALMDLGEWQMLSASERSLVYTAALLHDVAKPKCTQIDENGVASSPGHARKGEPMARQILEVCGVRTYAARETVSKLVRHHGLPLWFMEKKDMKRALILASLDVRLDLVALLAEADIRGRECADRQSLLDMIELFRETCRELGCYSAPREFASDHARVMYCLHEEYDENYAAYDDREFTVTMMCGLPGSGKDTWLRQNANDLPVVSLDAIRRTLNVLPGKDERRVLDMAMDQARDFLRAKQPFVWNATNLTKLTRSRLIGTFMTYGARVRIVVVTAPLKRTLAQNAVREGVANVPEHVIRGMLEKFEPPSLAECHQLLIVEDVGDK